MKRELTVAGKEFKDHLTSKRFLVIFAIMMLLAVISMAGGMAEYKQTLKEYKDNTAQNQQQAWYKEQVSSLQSQIAAAEASGQSADEISKLQYQLDNLVNPTMPSVLYVFTDMNQYLVIVAMVLSVAMGFDLISREKEEGSLRSLLSHPVYRDSIINGKLIGALAVLALVICSTFLLTIAIMMFYGIVPGLDDLLRIGAYFVIALIYCSVFFAIATMTSTIANTSAMSVLYTMGIVLVLFMITTFSGPIANAIMGTAPEYVPDPIEDEGIATTGSDNIAGSNDAQQYYEKRSQIIEAIDTISPIYGFSDKISSAILYKTGTSSDPYQQPSLLDSLSSVWTNLLALVIELIIPLAISYVMFMRTDIR